MKRTVEGFAYVGSAETYVGQLVIGEVAELFGHLAIDHDLRDERGTLGSGAHQRGERRNESGGVGVGREGRGHDRLHQGAWDGFALRVCQGLMVRGVGRRQRGFAWKPR